jgi:hypothetical protein
LLHQLEPVTRKKKDPSIQKEPAQASSKQKESAQAPKIVAAKEEVTDKTAQGETFASTAEKTFFFFIRFAAAENNNLSSKKFFVRRGTTRLSFIIEPTRVPLRGSFIFVSLRHNFVAVIHPVDATITFVDHSTDAVIVICEREHTITFVNTRTEPVSVFTTNFI